MSDGESVKTVMSAKKNTVRELEEDDGLSFIELIGKTEVEL